MENKGSVVTGRLMIPEGTQEPHEENGLGLGTGVRLSIEGGEDSRSAPYSRSRTAGGGYKCNTGCPGVPCTEDCFTIILELLSAGFSEYGELIRA